VKMRAGGLVDCEFIAQYLALRHAAEHPQVLAGATDRVLAALAEAGLLAPAIARRLIEATRHWRSLQGYLRLTAPADFDHVTVPAAIREGLARAAGLEDFAALERRNETLAEAVSHDYDRLIAAPAAELQKEDTP